MIKTMTDYGFVLARGDKRFRHFLKYTLFEADEAISSISLVLSQNQG